MQLTMQVAKETKSKQYEDLGQPRNDSSLEKNWDSDNILLKTTKVKKLWDVEFWVTKASLSWWDN